MQPRSVVAASMTSIFPQIELVLSNIRVYIMASVRCLGVFSTCVAVAASTGPAAANVLVVRVFFSLPVISAQPPSLLDVNIVVAVAAIRLCLLYVRF